MMVKLGRLCPGDRILLPPPYSIDSLTSQQALAGPAVCEGLWDRWSSPAPAHKELKQLRLKQCSSQSNTRVVPTPRMKSLRKEVRNTPQAQNRFTDSPAGIC